MKQKWNAIKIITMVVLFLLVLTAGVYPLVGGDRLLGRSLWQGQRETPGNFPQGVTPPQGGNFQPGQGNWTPPSGSTGQQFNGNDTFQGTGRISRNSTAVKLQRLLQYGLGSLVILFGALSIIGRWFDKKWGKVLAVITAAVVVAWTIPSLFRIMGGLTLIEAIVKIVLSVGLIVMVFLPEKKPVLTE